MTGKWKVNKTYNCDLNKFAFAAYDGVYVSDKDFSRSFDKIIDHEQNKP